MSVTTPIRPTISPKSITAEEFEWIEGEGYYDLIRGEVKENDSMPGAEHGILTFEFGFEVALYIREQGLGQCYAAETRFIIERNPDTAIAPDWAFIVKERLPEKRGKGFVPMAPDALLEVRSPSDTPREVEEKMQRWIAAGVRLAWELNPTTQTITVYRPQQNPSTLGIDDTLSGEEVIPGFAFSLRRLFAE